MRRCTAAIAKRSLRGEHDVGKPPTGKNKNARELALLGRQMWVFFLKAAHRLRLEGNSPDALLMHEMFETAQWALSSEVAYSLAQMAARGVIHDPVRAARVRERQDLVREWQKREELQDHWFARPAEERDAIAETENQLKLLAIDARLIEIDAILANEDVSNYAALVSPKPISVADVQALLRDSEALVLFLDTPEFKPTPEETFIWAVTKTDSRWVHSELGTKTLQEHVAALRCGLDGSNWVDASYWPEASDDERRRKREQIARRERCKTLTGADVTEGDVLPFDLARAHELYQGLFSEIEGLIKDKHLLIIPSGALTSLPFQVLVTKAPTSTSTARDYRNAAWLVQDHALSVLPSVASLAALRRHAKGSAAPEPFIGYGNPVLTGQPGCGSVIIPDKCPQEEIQVAAAPRIGTRSVAATEAVPVYFRNGLADVAAVKRLCPLADTAHEVKCVAKSLGAQSSSIVLAEHMTETALKKAPLNRYRVVHFATHGLLAGETATLAEARAEPALVMSPPNTATEEDDGLLTASEVAGLKLDADWVVMSACNTASGGEPGAEALSGLAKAFFYAGARALLVSHWPVDSYAATMLTSRTFAEMRKEKGIGRSEAFRRAMLALLSDAKRPWAAHPSVWAPFVVVGEGGAGQ
jgi:CHAT domain-containing protein